MQTFEVNELLPTGVPRTMIPSFETGNVTSEETNTLGESNSHFLSWISNPIGEKEYLSSLDVDTTASVSPKTKTSSKYAQQVTFGLPSVTLTMCAE